MLYYATFIPGLGELIAGLVRERLPDAEIRLYDGAVLFETSVGYDRLNFLCFNNIFAVISLMDGPAAALETHIAAFIKTAAADSAAKEIISHNNRKLSTFRINIFRENKPAAVNEKLRTEAERHIARISGLRANRSGGGAEFWFLYRDESGGSPFSVFMKRLTLRPSWEKSLHPGELPPPLAWMLCRLAQLKHDDTVLDPFCGYGSIPNAALKFFHITKFTACDNNEKAAAYTAARFRDRPVGTFTFYRTGFSSLVSMLPEKSVDAIITDPPWGYYDSGQEPQVELYKEMFGVFKTLLKETGRVVILGARTDDLPRAAGDRFVMLKHTPILLSGKKAAVYQFALKNPVLKN